MVRDKIKLLFKQDLHCVECTQAADLPRTSATRKPIPAAYPNGRWGKDYEKRWYLAKGINILNIVDCYSRFAFGAFTKGKTAREIAQSSLRLIHLYDPPRILKTDNGKEFNSCC
ncbi:hypothetical protein PoB_003697100 [Plakobranchus ocellatus]|uniref:Integrase catalytic domain-containing protein n=1 Tax=Plakobranchus ocellatus TaxID=259542 RepID=A0AAV4AH16_9GAST|nr:hypothetical protein PoB_003697100 [Plakobranchus ocellatus]